METDVSNENLDQFFYWINERHRIYRKRRLGRSPPWTADPILQQYKFTNVFRGLDAVSRDYAHEIRDPYMEGGTLADPAGLVADTIVYRLFNWPATWRILSQWRNPWDEADAKRALRRAQANGDKIFTGAYIVTNNGSTRPKIDIICEACTVAHEQAPTIARKIAARPLLEYATRVIADRVPCCGPFVSYEIVSDLRWSPLLAKAKDIMTWANPGPGATRGLNRIHGRKLTAKPSESQLVTEMRELLSESQQPGRMGKHVWPLDMRDVEHSLCEFDKYLRVKNGEGRPRSTFWAWKGYGEAA